MKIRLNPLCGRILMWSLAITALISGCQYPETEISEENFLDPPIENRPLAFWDWINGGVDSTRLVYELEQMKSQGMQGVFIWDVGALSDPEKMIPAGPSFLGEESLNSISTVLKHSARLGLNMGMITSSSWNAGGSWTKIEDASMELLSSVQTVSGSGIQSLTIRKPEKCKTDYARWISTVAVPHSGRNTIDYKNGTPVNLDSYVKDGKLTGWKAPEGKWDVVSFFMCATGQPLACPSPNSKGYMIDHLSHRATQRHFDTIITRLQRISTPADQLKYLEVDSYEVWTATDWSPEFIQEFKNRLGYDPVPYMPLLQGYASSDPVLAERFRGDYSRIVSEMIIENHFKQGTELSNKAGMKLFAEAGHGGYPRVDPLTAMGQVDVPMGEFWNGERFWVTKEASSAGHIYGKKVIASESLTGWKQWQDGPGDYKQLFDVAFCEGLNQPFFHTFAHNPGIAGKPGFVYHAGEHLNVNTTWWEMVRPFMDYISRCSYMLRIGNFVGDFCMYYGDQCPNLVPPKRIDPNIKPRYAADKCQHCGVDKPVDCGDVLGHDYDYINAEVINTRLQVKDGRLVLPSGISYRFMILPDREDISLDVLKKVEQFVSEGAVILGRKPTRTTGLQNYPACDREVQAIADRVWGKCDGKTVTSNSYGKGKVYWGITAKALLEEMGVRPDFEVKGTDNSDMHIDYIHHRTAAEDIYFVTNSNRRVEKISCTFRVEKNLVPEIWDAESGLIQSDVVYRSSSEGISLDLVMSPVASRFIVFKPKSNLLRKKKSSYDLQFGLPQADRSIDLSRDWTIRFDPAYGGPESYAAATLTDWSSNPQENIRYFSGKAVYTKTVPIAKEDLAPGTSAILSFEDIQETARVIINGQDCGILWTPPYQKEIGRYLKEGSNEIRIEVINNWNNRLVGDAQHPDGHQYTRTNVKYKFVKAGLLKSGISGKASIQIIQNK